MRSKGLSAAIVAALGSVLFSAAAISAPLNYHVDLSAHAPSNVEKVWCHHGYCDGYGDGGASVGGLIGTSTYANVSSSWASGNVGGDGVAFGGLAIGIAAVASVDGSSDLPLVPLAVVLAFVAGSAYSATTVSAQTALFENMDAAVRGRVFGVLASIVSAASLVPILVAGPLADRISAPLVVAIVAAAVLLVTAWSALLFGPRTET